jgi:ABC-2 type transport system permease protein
MLRKEFIQMRRDRLTLAMMLLLPMIQLMLFGYAIQTEVRHLPTVVLDESATTESRTLVSVLEQTQNFDIVARVASRQELRDSINAGHVKAGIVIPGDFQRDIKRRRTAMAQVVVDAADPLGSSAAISGASLAATVRASQLMAKRGAGGPPPLEVRIRPLYNPGLRSAVYIVPGMIGVLLSLTMLLITSMSVVRERERGTFEQLVVTPIGRTSMMLGKLLPFVIVGYVQMTTVLLLGWLLFRVPIHGNILLLYVITLGFILANLSGGLLISTVARTQAQAMQLSFFFLLPNILLSGFMFPREAMPLPAQWLGDALPLTYYLQVLRGILLRGVGISHLWPQTVTLLGFAVVLVVISVLRFSKTVE